MRPTTPFALAAALLASSAAFAQYPECLNAVQGRIAWNYDGSTAWGAQNVEKLCRGGLGAEPAQCFDHVMFRGVDWGGGTRWKWENALELCAGSQNEAATVGCFQRQLGAGRDWNFSLAQCRAGGPGLASPCEIALQGRIAWDYSGDKSWAPQNVDKLCRGGNAAEPARCFEQAMFGGVDWGGGTRWKWENALELCAGSQNHERTLGCLRRTLGQGMDWRGSLESCRAGGRGLNPPDCAAALQGRIAWDYSGDKSWSPQNTDKLCRGGFADEPARCFERAMFKNVNWGGGTHWKWENALTLCAGTQDSDATIDCFQRQVTRQVPWSAALEACRPGSSAQPVYEPPRAHPDHPAHPAHPVHPDHPGDPDDHEDRD